MNILQTDIIYRNTETLPVMIFFLFSFKIQSSENHFYHFHAFTKSNDLYWHFQEKDSVSMESSCFLWKYCGIIGREQK